MVSGALFFTRGPAWWLPATMLSLALFAVAVSIHRRCELARRRFVLFQAIKRDQLARMALDWAAMAPPPDVPAVSREHPFAHDLDLLGERSLCTCSASPKARAAAGSSRPAAGPGAGRRGEPSSGRRWCGAGARSLFRGRLRLHAQTRPREGSAEPAAHCGAGWRRGKSAACARAAGLALLAWRTSLFAGAQWAGLGPWWRATFAVYALLYLTLGRAASDLFPGAALQDALRQAGAVFDYLERARLPAGSGALVAVPRGRRALGDGTTGQPHCQRGGLAANPVLALILNAVVPWNLFLADRLERRGRRQRLPGWLAVWYELEALSSLANLAYLNPHYSFATLGDTGAPFRGEQLGHPCRTA